MSQHESKLIRVSDPAVRALLPRYLERRVADVLRIGELLAERDFTQIRVLAHNMRGSGAAYGVAAVSAIGKTIEHGARAEDVRIIASATHELAEYLAGRSGELKNSAG